MEDKMTQIDLFKEGEDFSVKKEPSLKFTGKEQCRTCEHILGLHFTHSNLYFCSIKKKNGGVFGKKITKKHPACVQFKKTDSETIDIQDGHYGGHYKTIKR